MSDEREETRAGTARSSASNRMLARLEARAAAGRPVRVAVIGTGDYGETLVGQLLQIPGMWPAVICDLDLERAAQTYVRGGIDPTEIEV
ncbi:MAG: hypothetical protein AB8I80_21675, partial [Anaerolineae bacterium]